MLADGERRRKGLRDLMQFEAAAALRLRSFQNTVYLPRRGRCVCAAETGLTTKRGGKAEPLPPSPRPSPPPANCSAECCTRRRRWRRPGRPGCLLRDLGGHGAVPADPSTLHGADAATTRFLLERILRESGAARRLVTSSPSRGTSFADAADADSGEPEDAAGSSPGLVPVDRTSAASGSETSPATADPCPLYGADAATTRFLLERILRESGVARRLVASSSPPGSSSVDAADTESGELEDPTESTPGLVPVSGTPDRADHTAAASRSVSSPATELHAPLESTARVPASRLSTLLGPNGRIVIVTNRLPVTANLLEDGRWHLVSSSGGLASALRGVKDVELLFVGWPGISVPEADRSSITEKLLTERCVPVFLNEEMMDKYYSGYCNNILWPLFHYLGLPQGYKFNKAKDFESQLKSYTEANQMFADTVSEIWKEGDVIWCHDYHLMLLPQLLKQSNRNMKVGWFLHTPFPSSEVYQALPNREALLKAVLEADLVGFHTYGYARHFASACTSLLGLEGCLGGIEFKGRIVKVDAFPIGIDAQHFKESLDRVTVKDKIAELKSTFAGRKVMLGVDRLDMIKGLLQKLLAFEKFLEENKGRASKVVLVQIAVPTRSDVPEYQELKSQVHEMVGRVNGKFGTFETLPIMHLNYCNCEYILCCSDVALITSLRDGMNLVSYEYVACQEANKGVLILSECAGAAQSLGAGAIIVNPWNTAEVARAMKRALDMLPDEREKRHRHNYEIVSAHTAQDWAENYVWALNAATIKAPLGTGKSVGLPIKEAAKQYVQSKSRLLILGFNATLTEQVQSFERRATDQNGNTTLKLNPGLKGSLKTLCDSEDTTVIVVSGHGKSVLDENFGEFKMWLSAENGVFLRQTGEDWTTGSGPLEITHHGSVKKVFEYFTRRTPKSYREPRDRSFVWNYKYAEDQFGTNQAKDMLQHLGAYSLSNQRAEVIQGSRSIEVRPVGVTKGNAINKILQDLDRKKIITTPVDYVLCIGHFLAKDEDIYTLFDHIVQTESGGKTEGWQEDCMSIEFDLKPEKYFPCTVGRERSLAQYKVEGTSDVACLLHELASADTVDHDMIREL
ncbi:Alpha,alpha-trehalose-phosphate synthase [Hordeum vulgare]|nr:Alpha,alpha-trehalose-phosphate synthase [Hordeum vulgare]